MARHAASPAARVTDELLSPADGLAQLSFAVLGMLERRAAEHDLSMAQLRLLGVLRDRTPTMNQLARLMALDKSSITGLVERAERRGLVRRVPSVTDRRSVLVRLTAGGREFVTEAARRFEADVTALVGLLPVRDRGVLARLVSRLLVAQAAEYGVDLFATATEAEPGTPAVPR
jgi:MarR family transcriptional regulator, lower aerobic nicotinate degradation pathway regulator